MSIIRVPLNSRKYPGRFAIIDADDAGLVAPYRWIVKINGNTTYAAAEIRLTNGHRDRFLMHRVVFGARSGEMVDHIDGDGLNNRRSNLRLATKSENAMNSRALRNNTSGYRGVTFCKRTGRWAAHLKHYGQFVWLGRHDTAEEASAVYEAAAIEYFGEFYRPQPHAVVLTPYEREAA